MAASPIPATGVGWDTAIPDDGQAHGNDYNEHRETKLAFGIRMNKEHVTIAGSSAGGEHKPGSARIYRGDYSIAGAGDDLPTTKPDGSTALDANDAGMLAHDTDASYGGIYYEWNGTSWAGVDLIITNIASSTKDEDNMASNSASHVPTQQSVKAYVDALGVTAAAQQESNTGPFKGLIIKYAESSGSSGATNVTFGTAFPTACFGVWPMVVHSTAKSVFVNRTAMSKTGFSYWLSAQCDNLSWFAIGI